MREEPNIRELLTEIKAASQSVEARDSMTIERVNEFEHSISDILVGMRWPGSESNGISQSVDADDLVRPSGDRADGSYERKAFICNY